MIITLSGADDATAGRVESELARRSARYTRVDLSDFPQRIMASASLDESGCWTGQMRHADGWSVKWEDITALYYRRPSNFNPAPGLADADRRFVVAEARGGFGGVLASLNSRWVNHPFRVADCEFKPVQLAVAQQCGFTVPATVITNDGHSVHAFAGASACSTVRSISVLTGMAAGGFLNVIRTGNGDSSPRPQVCRLPRRSPIC